MSKKKYKNNELVKRRRRKRLIRRSIITIIFLVSLLSVLCFNLPYFEVTNINVNKNKALSSDYILSLSGIKSGVNIFYASKSKIIKNIKSDPYVKNVEVIKQLPNSIEIDVVEYEPEFYIKQGNNFSIINEVGIVVDVVDKLPDDKLVEIIGITGDVSKGKDAFSESPYKESFLEFGDLINRNMSDISFRGIDLSDDTNILLYSGDMQIKIGTAYDLEKKLNTAINILSMEQVKGKKGYINVSVLEKPVYYIN